MKFCGLFPKTSNVIIFEDLIKSTQEDIMEIWGVGIFEDELSDDIKHDFSDLVSRDYSPEVATSILMEKYLYSLNKYEEYIFWVALAAIQWKLGQVDNKVRDKAISIIESGGDLKRWLRDPVSQNKRKKVLEKLKKQLLSPPPAPKKVPKKFVAQTNFEPGDALIYQLLSGKYIVLKVVSIKRYPSGDCYPILEVCNWIGNEVPSKEGVNNLEIREGVNEYFVKCKQYLEVFPSGKNDYPKERINVVYKDVKITLLDQDKTVMVSWKDFDEALEIYYSLK